MNERERIIAGLTKLRDEIRRKFLVAARWNRRHPMAPPINPDPYGDMRPLLDHLDRMLANDPGHGLIGSPVPDGWPPS